LSGAAGATAGKAGLVTGGASGIGRASAVGLGAAGAAVMVADVDETAGAKTVKAIIDVGGTAAFARCDVSRDADVRTLVAATIRAFGRLDFAHNNAGISSPAAALTADEDEKTFDHIPAVNLKGVWLGMRHEIPAMLERGGGAIVNNASTGGLVGIPNAVCPGLICTDLYDARPPEMQRRILEMQPIGRVGEPEEVAAAVVWLCSDAASLVTGVALPIDGAWVAR
jgi:NAD(P)-dependent dehydrogenase (short-subunit alcohol dehydrogenase family)